MALPSEPEGRQEAMSREGEENGEVGNGGFVETLCLFIALIPISFSCHTFHFRKRC